MQQCRKCRVNIEGEKERCPLCQGELTGTPEEEMYPRFDMPRFGSLFLIKLISFIAITALIICFGTDYMISDGISWSLISAAGIICGWLTTTVGITYRKRILKNITCQLFLVSSLSVLWDRFTGWYGWSLNFVLPCACMVSMISVFVISRVLKMRPGEYMLYLLIGALFGLLPFICVLSGLVTFRYPSVICTILSLILFAGLFTFRGKSAKDEMERRFHL